MTTIVTYYNRKKYIRKQFPMVKKIVSILCILISLFMLATTADNTIKQKIEEVLTPSECINNPQNVTILQGSAKSNSRKEVKELYAKSACLMDVLSGRIIYDKNADTPLPMASTTKIMTCILALENGNPDSVVKASKYASGMPDVQLNMQEGEEFRLNDLLYSLMLESHNDTAVAIAEHIGGTVEGFAAMMNRKAADIGCLDTCFVTPNGLDSGDHHSTASDLCRIASYAINNPEFIKIIQTSSHSFSNIAGTRQYSVNNHDSFLTMYDGAIGIKTGFTGKAGYCFVGAASRNDVTLVSAVLASGWPPNKSYKWKDTCSLMDYGFDNYKNIVLLNGKINLQPISVRDKNNRCNSTIKETKLNLTANYSMLSCDSDNASLVLEIPEYIAAPVYKDEIIGKATLTVNDNAVCEYPVTAAYDVPEYTLSNYLSIIIDTFMLKM